MGKCRTNELGRVGGGGGQPTGARQPGFSADWRFCAQICRALRFRTGSVGLSKPLFLRPAFPTVQMR